MKVLWGVETRTFEFCYNLTIILRKQKMAILPKIWQFKEANHKKIWKGVQFCRKISGD